MTRTDEDWRDLARECGIGPDYHEPADLAEFARFVRAKRSKEIAELLRTQVGAVEVLSRTLAPPPGYWSQAIRDLADEIEGEK